MRNKELHDSFRVIMRKRLFRKIVMNIKVVLIEKDCLER